MTDASSSTTRRWKYDVFISFRGKDTRINIARHLYAALRRASIFAYIDEIDLMRGAVISPALLTAIKDSMAIVIIFSLNYADSTWCLEELVHMMKFKEEKIILPIFYYVDRVDVDPSDLNSSKLEEHSKNSNVEMQSENFRTAFLRLKEQHKDHPIVSEWINALKEATNLPEWLSSDTGSDAELVKHIVRDVSKKLIEKCAIGESKNLVGIPSHIWQITQQLSDDVRIIGLWGMPGIGKTTIAKVLFRQFSNQYDSCYFVENVKKKSEKLGLEHLLYDIYSKVLNENNLNMGSLELDKHFMKDRLHRKKVLIVLDNVENSLELDELLLGGRASFGSGSRLIITTRERKILKGVVEVEDIIHEVKGLDDVEALQVFSLYAFRQNHPPEHRLEQSNTLVNFCKGNPLALRVFGSALFRKIDRDWESLLDGLRRPPNRKNLDVFSTISGKLGAEEKATFLDVAFFLRGKESEGVNSSRS